MRVAFSSNTFEVEICIWLSNGSLLKGTVEATINETPRGKELSIHFPHSLNVYTMGNEDYLGYVNHIRISYRNEIIFGQKFMFRGIPFLEKDGLWLTIGINLMAIRFS